MELANNVTEWASIKEETAVWTSDVDYWIDLMHSFQTMLDQKAATRTKQDELKPIVNLQNIVRYYSNEFLLDLKSRLYHFKEDVLHCSVEERVPCQTSIKRFVDFEEEFRKTEATIKGYASEFDMLKTVMNTSNKIAVKRVLIPSDLSLNARRAADYALSLLGNELEYVLVCHVLRSPFKTGTEATLADTNAKAVKEEALQKELERLEGAFPKLKGKIFMQHGFGFLQDYLEQVAEAERMDLIVMGTKGASGLSAKLMGSNTSRMLAKTTRPLLVVPNQTPLLPPEKIMLAVDMELTERPPYFGILTSIVDYYQSALELIHVDHDDSKISSAHDRYVEQSLLEILGLPQSTIEHVVSDSVQKAINNQVASGSVDMLCIINHHKGWLHRALGRSVSTQMVLETHTPLLILHHELD